MGWILDVPVNNFLVPVMVRHSGHFIGTQPAVCLAKGHNLTSVRFKPLTSMSIFTIFHHWVGNTGSTKKNTDTFSSRIWPVTHGSTPTGQRVRKSNDLEQ